MRATRGFEMYRPFRGKGKKRFIENLHPGKSFLYLVRLGTLVLIVVAGCEKKEKAPPPAPPEVTVAEVVQKNVPAYVEWVAQLNGPVNADITPKVQGYLLTQDYQNGFFVKKGQLLFTIDPRPFVATLDQDKAQIAVAQANLGEARKRRPRHPAGRAERDPAKAARHRSVDPGCEPGASGRSQSADGAGGIDSRMDQGLLAD